MKKWGGGGSCEKIGKLGGVIQFSTDTPPNPTRHSPKSHPPPPANSLKNERSLSTVSSERVKKTFGNHTVWFNKQFVNNYWRNASESFDMFP